MRLAPVVVALVLLPALAGCVNEGKLLTTASAPKEGGGMTILVGAVNLKADGSAAFVIKKEGRVVYPGIDALAKAPLALAGGEGSAFVPYNAFVVGNGVYEVVVEYAGETRSTSAAVDKWVEFVYLHPILRGANVQVDVQLSRASGGLPQDRIIAEGELRLAVYYRGLDGKVRDSNYPVKVVTVTTPGDQTYTQVQIPKSSFNKGPGWYEVEPKFDNYQASGNVGVAGDPSMAQRSPPWNWICIDTCA